MKMMTDVAIGKQMPTMFADHSSRRDALGRYGIERQPGPEDGSDGDAS
jgi:hypothetical protein